MHPTPCYPHPDTSSQLSARSTTTSSTRASGPRRFPQITPPLAFPPPLARHLPSSVPSESPRVLASPTTSHTRRRRRTRCATMMMSAAHTHRRRRRRVSVVPGAARASQSSRSIMHIISHLYSTRGRPTRRRASPYSAACRSGVGVVFQRIFTFQIVGWTRTRGIW